MLVSGADFYSNPRLSPDGSKLAWVSWSHPNMPWDDTALFAADVAQDGGLSNHRQVLHLFFPQQCSLAALAHWRAQAVRLQLFEADKHCWFLARVSGRLHCGRGMCLTSFQHTFRTLSLCTLLGLRACVDCFLTSVIASGRIPVQSPLL